MDGGVLPVIKHMPGHGRAQLDTHFDLPQVELTLAELDPTLKPGNDRIVHRDGRADVLGQVPGTFGIEFTHGIVDAEV